jgi:hypothetical protein
MSQYLFDKSPGFQPLVPSTLLENEYLVQDEPGPDDDGEPPLNEASSGLYFNSQYATMYSPYGDPSYAGDNAYSPGGPGVYDPQTTEPHEPLPVETEETMIPSPSTYGLFGWQPRTGDVDAMNIWGYSRPQPAFFGIMQNNLSTDQSYTASNSGGVPAPYNYYSFPVERHEQ